MLFCGLFIASCPKFYSGNPDWYMEWLSTVDQRLIFWTWEPPPFLLATPPPPPPGNMIGPWNDDQTIWPYRLSTCPCGWRTAKQYPRASVLSFRFFSNCSDKQPSGQFCLGLFWHSLCEQMLADTASSPFSSLIIVICSSSSRNLTTCFNPGVKVSCYAFLFALVSSSFAWILLCFSHQFLLWEFLLKSWYRLAVVYMLVFALNTLTPTILSFWPLTPCVVFQR